MAPHIIWPLRFVLPYADGLRPAWLLRLGLFLYDHIGGRKLLPATRTLDMTVWEIASPGGNPRHGILGLDTTRGDRLFISLLGSAFIHLAWLGLIGPNLWWALALSMVYAVGVFRFV